MAAFVMPNATFDNLPPLPAYTLSLQPSLIPGMSDLVLQTISPIAAYWIVSIFFQILDSWDFFSEYRLHTPAELLKRNKVTKYEVFRDVILQQVIQAITGYSFSCFDPPEMVGKQDYNIAVWAQRIRRAERFVPRFFAVLGFDSPELATRLAPQSSTLAAILAGGRYDMQGFATWELMFGKAVYFAGVPMLQFAVAIIILDTWQYFLHRGMHMNKFLYTWLHSRHHRLYVPYAFGALYNHPIEGFFMDTLGAGIGYLITGMTVRQGMVFFTCSTIKTVDDHCGYHFPWDPLQHITSNNAAYHDVHHQSWGIKTNFSQPYFTFWDRILDTRWAGGDTSARYQRNKLLAQKKVDADLVSLESSITNCPAINPALAGEQAAAGQQQVLENERGRQVLKEENHEELEAKKLRRSPRRRISNFDAKSLSDKVSGSLYGRTTPILKANAAH